jgi:AraC-like DNA-binding protein
MEGESVETYRASNLPTRTRATAWNALYSSRIDLVDLTPADRDTFEAEIRLGNLGPVSVVRMTCGRSSIDRTPRHIGRASERTYTFILQVRGSGVFAHYGHEATLSKGDFILCDSAAPHSYRVDDSSEVVMLRVPANVLKEHLPLPECLCGRRLVASEGLTSTVAALTLSLCEELEAGLSCDFHSRVARSLLEMIATSYAVAFNSLLMASSIVSGRHANVKLFIEQNLRDPGLSPASIASRLKLSSRYLRMVFAVGNETVSAYIVRRRLEECARQMADPRWRGHTISEIAFSWGFNSAPHFTRRFRDRYKISPRNYRQRTGRHSGAAASSAADPNGLHVDELADAGGAQLAAVT